ncbi:FxsA family protein [Candidatus Nanopelagicales bacterium]|nr:FxsA family protein [Candidatus Nanopelagicales bacterium]
MRRSPLGTLIFFGYPILEIVLVIWVASLIGWGWVFIILLVGIGLGLAVMRMAGMAAFQALRTPMQHVQPFTTVDPVTGESATIYPNQEMSPEDLETAALELRQSGLLFAAGVFLATPGFITDLVGLILLPPPVRAALAARQAARASRSGVTITGETVSPPDSGSPAGTTNSSTRADKHSPEAIEGVVLPPEPRRPEDDQPQQ